MPDNTSTRIISRELVFDGVKFRWWAVGENPSLVTVKNSLFGSLAEFCLTDPAQFAVTLAEKLLAKHSERAAELRREHSESTEGTTSFEKTGWFQKPKA